jgi:hypothetical protein
MVSPETPEPVERPRRRVRVTLLRDQLGAVQDQAVPEEEDEDNAVIF